MSWAIGFDSTWNRDIGYGVPAVCDHPECNERIDRGLSHVCGGEPYGGDRGCGLYFCDAHLLIGGPNNDPQMCERCCDGERAFDPKPDVPEWTQHKMTDPSWASWRGERIAELESKLAEQHAKMVQQGDCLVRLEQENERLEALLRRARLIVEANGRHLYGQLLAGIDAELKGDAT